MRGASWKECTGRFSLVSTWPSITMPGPDKTCMLPLTPSHHPDGVAHVSFDRVVRSGSCVVFLCVHMHVCPAICTAVASLHTMPGDCRARVIMLAARQRRARHHRDAPRTATVCSLAVIQGSRSLFAHSDQARRRWHSPAITSTMWGVQSQAKWPSHL